MEKSYVIMLTVLYLSTALDTINHDILLDRLTEWFGLDNLALGWIASDLKIGYNWSKFWINCHRLWNFFLVSFKVKNLAPSLHHVTHSTNLNYFQGQV